MIEYCVPVNNNAVEALPNPHVSIMFSHACVNVRFCGNLSTSSHVCTFLSGHVYAFASAHSPQYTRSKPHVQNTCGWEHLSIPDVIHAFKLEDNAELPPLDNLLHMLQKCRNEENVYYAQHMYLLLCSGGLEALLGNYLVPMLVKCGSLTHAQQTFHKVAEPNFYCWTSLIHGYMDCTESEHALKLFQNMQDQGVHSSSITFLALIKACGRLKLLERGYEIHTDIVKGGFEDDTFLGSTLVDMYARCSSLIEAQAVFDKLPARDAVTWNTLIAGYIDSELGHEALNSLQKMQQEGIAPDAFTCLYALKICGSIGSLQQGQEWHAKIIEEGFESDSFLGNTLVDFYGKFGLFIEAEAVFDELLIQDVVPWTALIVSYTDNGLHKEVLECYARMHLNNVHPNAVTYACILKACSSAGTLESIQSIHSEIAKRGQESESHVGNLLVDVYARSGCITEAQSVFDKLLARDVVAWTALLGGYVEHGLGEVTLNYLEQMLLDGISPNPITFICCLKACSSRTTIDTGRHLHIEITMKAYESDPSLGNALVDMYAKCGSFSEACQVFDMLPVRNVVTWNTLITACTESGLDEEALDCIEQMELEGVLPNVITFSCSLKCCSRIGAMKRGRILHTTIVKQGFERDSTMCNAIVDLYASCALLLDARKVLDGMPGRDVITWTALIEGYSKHGYSEEALQCLEEMQLERVSPNAITFDSSLKACSISTGPLERVQQIHAEITKKGFSLDPCIGNSLVMVYVKCGFLAEGRAIFDELPVQNPVAWNALIEGYSGNGSFKEAKELFHNLPVQDVFSWTVLLKGYLDQELGEEALYWFEQMQLKGVSPDAAMFACGLKACGIVAVAGRGLKMHLQIAKQGIEQDLFLQNSLLDMYTKCGLFAEAQDMFEKLLVRDIISWTSFTTGYASLGLKDQVFVCLKQMHLDQISPNLVFWNSIISAFAEIEEIEATFLFILQMQEQGQIPDIWTMTSALKACGKAASLALGKRLHAQVTKSRVIDTTQGMALIDMYGKCGNMIDAQRLFDELPTRDLVKWNALIDGYARLGESAHVFCLFESMEMEGIQPNETTFLSILMVCSHAGFAHKSQVFFETMCIQHDSDPSIKHFNSMASLLGRAGRLGEALVMIEKMSLLPDLVTWRTLLAASRLCNDLDIGVEAYDGAVAFDGKYSAPFVLLSNMYADGFVEPTFA